ncbi:MAG: YrdB family protein [Cyclobacteriaceae bacterium]|nr:YrdB family protein [Cyclobacteriaceae bacterium]
MGKHPLNLALRFLLEITTLIVTGYWGFHLYSGFLKYLIGIGSPLLLGIIWGVFAVPNDPSRSGKTVVNTPGIIRLIIELAFFGFGAYAFYQVNMVTYSYIFASVTLLHYLLSMDRIKWLLTSG